MIKQDHSRVSLLGLALGDALGSQFFVPANRPAFEHRSLPPAPWAWTDDTEMACAIWLVLTQPVTSTSVGGDIDTTCAIVGGIVATRAVLPRGWLDLVEPLPKWAAG